MLEAFYFNEAYMLSSGLTTLRVHRVQLESPRPDVMVVYVSCLKDIQELDIINFLLSFMNPFFRLYAL